jgi:hypothetical protein
MEVEDEDESWSLMGPSLSEHLDGWALPLPEPQQDVDGHSIRSESMPDGSVVNLEPVEPELIVEPLMPEDNTKAVLLNWELMVRDRMTSFATRSVVMPWERISGHDPHRKFSSGPNTTLQPSLRVEEACT